MKKQKNTKVVEPQALATGIYKKRVWPWLLILVSILIVAAFIALIAIEFFNAPRCENHTCETFLEYAIHYNPFLMIACAFVLIVILCVIISVRKRYLTVTATTLTFKKGRKVVEIPIDYIKSIDTGASSITVKLPYKKFKIAKLKNKTEVYDVIASQMKVLAEAPTAPAKTIFTPISNEAIINAEGKLAYFKKLYDSKLITFEQYEKYITQSLRTNSII